MSFARMYLLKAGKGRPTRVDTPGYVLLAGAAETEGRFTLVDCRVKHDIPKHIHHREDESFYLLEGRLKVTFGDQIYDVDPGEFMFLPRGVPHAVQRIGDEEPRVLAISAPAGFEHLVEDLCEAQEKGLTGLPTEEFAKIAARHGWELVTE